MLTAAGVRAGTEGGGGQTGRRGLRHGGSVLCRESDDEHYKLYHYSSKVVISDEKCNEHK